MVYDEVIAVTLDARISRRWSRWAYLGEQFRERHEYWMRYLLRRGVAVRTIQINNLDDPLLGDNDRDRLLADYLERKANRLGMVPISHVFALLRFHIDLGYICFKVTSPS